MKSLQCDQCELAFEAETFDAWIAQMKEHYMQEHKDVMEKPRENPQKEMRKWMVEERERFIAAS